MPEPRHRPVPDYVTRPLLARITEGALDEDYEAVASRRAGEIPTGATRPGWVTAAVIGVIGVLVGVAAVQTSANADVIDASRTTLTARIAEERKQVEAQQERIASLQDDTIGLQDELDEITTAQQDAAARRERLEVLAGYTAVRGEGLQVVVSDRPDRSELVQDEDLALLVDGLWGAGAEAVAINEQRVTVLSGIRNRGIAVLVGGQPVNPPFRVQAIGDQDTLAADLLDTTHGQRFFDLADQLGFPYTMQNEDELLLPEARGPRLVHALRGLAGTPGMDPEEEAAP